MPSGGGEVRVEVAGLPWEGLNRLDRYRDFLAIIRLLIYTLSS